VVVRRGDTAEPPVGDEEVVAFVLYIPIRRDTALPVPVAAADAAETAKEVAEDGALVSSVSVEGVVLVLEEDDSMRCCSSALASR